MEHLKKINIMNILNNKDINFNFKIVKILKFLHHKKMKTLLKKLASLDRRLKEKL